MNKAKKLTSIYQNRKKPAFRDIGEGHAIITMNGGEYFVQPMPYGGYEVNQINVVGCGSGVTVEEAAREFFK